MNKRNLFLIPYLLIFAQKFFFSVSLSQPLLTEQRTIIKQHPITLNLMNERKYYFFSLSIFTSKRFARVVNFSERSVDTWNLLLCRPSLATCSTETSTPSTCSSSHNIFNSKWWLLLLLFSVSFGQIFRLILKKLFWIEF